MKQMDLLKFMMELNIQYYLVLDDITKFMKVLDRSEKISITDSINQNFARIKIDSYTYLPIEKMVGDLC